MTTTELNNFCKEWDGKPYDRNMLFDLCERQEEITRNEIIKTATSEFDDAITQLGLDYHIPDSVMEKYCHIFKKKLEY